ncbi:MAG TPA: ferritin-like domain-containing protein, partial [Polyangia bacterium]|nr:ferritin-like domain-containing protein [Polyangia bacterium]
MEHASVAAFARFSLELLALGAPSDLVRGAQSAMGDELSHARIAFGLATAYGGAAVGPGPLAIERALADTDFVSVVRTAFLEACIGETCAAAEVTEARDAATDPIVRAALTQIAEDELRHATLGYRFVQWALESASPETAHALRRVMTWELAALASEPVRLDGAAAHSAALAAHGFISERALAEARRQAMTDIVRPCVAALLGSEI